jgi:4-carboxymuconolactone decarboxylase
MRGIERRRPNSTHLEGGIMATRVDPREGLRAVTPKLMDITDKVLFGDVWERPGLSKRDRSLITVAVLTALYRPEQLRGHVQRALANGVTKDEIGELITHVAFYSGWPTAVTAASVAKSVFDEEQK